MFFVCRLGSCPEKSEYITKGNRFTKRNKITLGALDITNTEYLPVSNLTSYPPHFT